MISSAITKEGILILTFNRLEKLNAINDEFLSLISQSLIEAQKDDTIKVVILYGGVSVFAAGADINELAEKDLITATHDPRVSYWQSIAQFDKPLIAAVNGYAFGAGCELAMHADIIIAGFNAQFAQPEINLGIMPGAGGTQRLIRLVGKSIAMQMCLSGTPIDTKQAYKLGMISEITVPEATLARALLLAKKIALKSPLALKMIKKTLFNAMDTSLTAGLVQERQAFISLCASEDKKEGVQAFLQKRKPNFKGK